MNFTSAKPSDFKQVRLLDPHSKYIDPEKIRQKLNSQEIILAYKNEAPIGLIKFSYIWATRPMLDLIFVKETHRKQGIGTKLLAFLEDYLKKQGHNYLISSSQKNEPKAQKWHEKQGFQRCGELSCLNLPHETTPEIFYYKHINPGNPQKDELATYPIIPE